MKPYLSNVTAVIIDCVNYDGAFSAITKSMQQCKFAEVILLTDLKVASNLPFKIVNIPKISNKEQYSNFIIKELYKYINTEFALIIQHDGYVLNGDCWSTEFTKYDYIGATWYYTDGRNVGNGGFSLRSKKLLEIVANDNLIIASNPEDDVFCRTYRPYLEAKYHIKYAPENIADMFSFEYKEPICKTFGFHGNEHKPYKPTVVIKRSAALGDCIAVEPLIDYYWNKGYNVYIDMPIYIAEVFSTYHHPIKHISFLTDKRIKYELIDLDGSYENNPNQLHLKSYYETAGIKDGVIKNPKLTFPINHNNRMFLEKYVVLHIDKREQPYRNVYGVNWEQIVKKINEMGYIVVQVGIADRDVIAGAIQFNTPTTNFLLYLISGASAFIGIDSGVAAVAVACNIKSMILFGSVESKYIHPNLENIIVIEHKNPCLTTKCWHSVIGGTSGKDCIVNKSSPPCTQFTTNMVMDNLINLIE